MPDYVSLKRVRECPRGIHNPVNVPLDAGTIYGLNDGETCAVVESHPKVIGRRQTDRTDSQEYVLTCQGYLACAEGGIHHRSICGEVVPDECVRFLKRNVSLHVALDNGRSQPLSGCGVVHDIGPHDPSGWLSRSENTHRQRLLWKIWENVSENMSRVDIIKKGT